MTTPSVVSARLVVSPHHNENQQPGHPGGGSAIRRVTELASAGMSTPSNTLLTLVIRGSYGPTDTTLPDDHGPRCPVEGWPRAISHGPEVPMSQPEDQRSQAADVDSQADEALS